MKRAFIVLGMVMASVFFYANSVAADAFFTPCMEVHCVTIGFCHTACVDCDGPIGDKECIPPK
jgi:hypothetical protein